MGELWSQGVPATQDTHIPTIYSICTIGKVSFDQLSWVLHLHHLILLIFLSLQEGIVGLSTFFLQEGIVDKAFQALSLNCPHLALCCGDSSVCRDVESVVISLCTLKRGKLEP